MKTIPMLAALSLVTFTFARAAGADGVASIPRAPFPSEVLDLNIGDDSACELRTPNQDHMVRLRWLRSESSVLRQSIDDDKVTGSVKVPVAKIGEADGIAVYAYRESNAIVLFVEGSEVFSTSASASERMFMVQSCGLGIALLHTKAPAECGGESPGFCGKLAHLDGKGPGNKAFTVVAGVDKDQQIRVIVRTKPSTRP